MLFKKLNLSAFALSLFASLFAFVLTSCSDDDPINEVPVVTEGAYILNSGTMGNNNTSLSYYDFSTSNVTSNVYLLKNNRILGDTGNDMLIYGSKIYYAISGSGKIAITNKDGVSIKDIQSVNNGHAQEPRSFVAFEGKVYVVFYDGYLARIDTSSLSIDQQQVKLGRDPEKVTVANRKLYVTNSGGQAFPTNYDKTVTVISVDGFSFLKTLEVAQNPSSIQTDDQGDVYVASVDYQGKNGALQRINSKTDVVTVIDGFKYGAKLSPIHNDKMYIIEARYTENWTAMPAVYSVFDTKSEKLLTNQFIKDEIVLKSPGGIDIEPVSGNVYISDSPSYTGNGDIYVFSSEGKLLREKFSSGGVNPIKVCFVTK